MVVNIMQVVRTLKFRVYPDAEQKKLIEKTFLACKFIYNKLLERFSKAYKRRGESISTNPKINFHFITEMKAYEPWLKEFDINALRSAVTYLCVGFQKFFDGVKKHQDVGYPRFKSKHNPVNSFATTGPTVKYLENGVQLPKLKVLKHYCKGTIEGKICTATLSKDNLGRYWVSITYKFEKDVEKVVVDDASKVVGLDYASHGLYVDSEGNSCNKPRHYHKAQKMRTRIERQLSHRFLANGGKKSKNYLKLKERLSKLEARVANQRTQFLHETSKKLVENFDAVCVEDLYMKAISNSKGLGLGKSTSDNGYGRFCEMLDYKLESQGKEFLKVAWNFPSSQLCHCCGFKNPAVKNLKVREWTCPECGTHHDRDVNAAINIKIEGCKKLGLA